MSRPMLIVGPQGSGKTLRAREEARKRGCPYAVISFDEFTVHRFRPWLAVEPKTVIVEEVPDMADWRGVTIHDVRMTLNATMLQCEQQGKGTFVVPAPRFILVSHYDLTTHPGWGNQEFEVVALGKGGPGRGQGNRKGSRRVQDPKRTVLSQRYSETEKRLIESVAGGEVGTFIHDAAVDRARQFAEAQEG